MQAADGILERTMKSSAISASAAGISVFAPNTPTAAPAMRAPRQAILYPERDLLLKLGFGLLMVDLFLILSRALEVVAIKGGVTLPYVSVSIHLAALGCALFSGRLRAVLFSPVGIGIALFSGWMALSSLMSFWKGGSFDTVVHDWLPTLAGFLACGLIVSRQQARKIMGVIALGATSAAAASWFLGAVKDERMALDAGTLGNPNDLSMLLLLGAPFLLIPILAQGKRVAQVLSIVAGLLIILVVFRAGSRSGFLALTAMAATLFCILPIAGKLKMAFCSVILVGGALAFGPAYTLYRYATIFTDPTQVADYQSEAFGSKKARERLLMESIQMTVDHPIFGVGPGAFLAVQADNAKKEGRASEWRVSHNAYTQLSAEMGVPALIIYLIALSTGLANVRWIWKRRFADPSGTMRGACVALLISIVGVCVNYIFSSTAYLFYLPLLLGLSVAFRGVMEREMQIQSAAPAPVRPAPFYGIGSPIAPATPAAAPATRSTLTPPAAPEYSYRFLGRARRVPRSS